MTRLDEMMTALKAEATDRRLDQLEPRVWSRIEALRSGAAATWFGRLRAATVALSLIAGVTIGGAAATAAVRAPHEASVFSAHADLAPSTLLEGGR